MHHIIDISTYDIFERDAHMLKHGKTNKIDVTGVRIYSTPNKRRKHRGGSGKNRRRAHDKPDEVQLPVHCILSAFLYCRALPQNER